MGLYGQMPDVPWHIGSPKMDEDDTRRHKARCVYYDNGTKKCRRIESPYWLLKCGGSSHCQFYLDDPSVVKRTDPIGLPQFGNERVKQRVEGWEIRSQVGDLITVRNLRTGECSVHSIRNLKSKTDPISKRCYDQVLGFEFDMKGVRFRLIEIDKGRTKYKYNEKKKR